MRNWRKHIKLWLTSMMLAPIFAYSQIGSDCTIPFNIDGTTPSPYNYTFNMASGVDFWVEFKIDPSTTNRYVSVDLSNGTQQTKYIYEVYGPYDNTYNCSTLGSTLDNGESFSFANGNISGNCITYDESHSTPDFYFQLSSSATNTRYYLVKITLTPGEMSDFQSFNVSTGTPVLNQTNGQTTYCDQYNEGTISPCATNDGCETPITICTDFNQSHDCANCGVNGQHTRFYVLDILHPNTTVNFNVPTFYTNSSVTYSISNQMIYGPCDPSLMLPSNLLYSFTGQSTSYTFANTGQYLLNVAIQQTECPTIDIDFEDIDANCQQIAPPPTVDFQAVCDGNNLISITNLVYNGDFEVGNQPENTTQINSDDIYQASISTNPSEGHYAIVQEPFVLNTVIFTNHTANVVNNGNFMFAHDDLSMVTDEYIWKKEVHNLLPNTDYRYEAWFTPSHIQNSAATDNLNLYINGQVVASKNRANVTPGVWEKVEFVWNSGNNAVADLRIEIENNNTVDDGRIFIDDISFTMVEPEMECCSNQDILFDLITTGDVSGATFTWNYGDGSPATASNTHSYTTPGTYTVTLDVTYPDGSITTIVHSITIIDCDYLCETCIGSFAPIPGQKYVISAWAKELSAPATKTSYDNPELRIAFNDGNNTVIGPYIPTGEIIDGWQRIEIEFTIPSTAQDMEILLNSASGEVLFDDIRVFPFNSNMKSFVYDPINLRLVAELDERHYATYYEYDESGQLIRVKKETERGIKTIQENRSNTSKNE